ncbi:MAG: AAA family ATPase [Bacteroidia bacterium]|nr:AAA family ATPase [Bacteroidia bacterium]
MNQDILTYYIKLKSLSLKNFRGAREMDISFDELLTVFIGNNGAGKSTVLDGLAYFLKYLESLITGMGYNPNITGLKDLDVNIHASMAELNLEMALNDALHSLHIEINRDSFEIPVSSSEGDASIYELQTDVYEGLGKGQKMHLPVLAYYGANSLMIRPDDIAGNEAIENEYRGIYNAYKNGLSASSFRFQDFFRWFDLQQKIGLQKGRNSKLDTVRVAISAMLSEGDIAYGNLHVDWNETGDILELPKGEDRLNVLMLSSGEKTLLALVADLARRLAIANPHSNTPLTEGTGIVLIDEIDLHLHPKWQRRVVPKLLEIFPKVQFVVTTHSPLVLGKIHSKHIRILDQGHVFGSDDTYGHDVSDILEDQMKVSGGIFDKDFEELFKLISDNQRELAVQRFTELQQKIEGTTPDLVKAEHALMRRNWL